MVDCAVQVNYESVPTSSKELLVNFESDVRNYVNNYQWGEGDPDEKISCTLNIFVKSVIGENQYVAQVFVGSQRPIYGSDQSTAVLRLMDENWEFTYVKERPIDHNIYTFSSLGSFLDFYMLLILGYDYDTYERLGGTPYLRRPPTSPVGAIRQGSGMGRDLGIVQPDKARQRATQREYRAGASRDVGLPLQRVGLVGIRQVSRAGGTYCGHLEVVGAARKKLDPQNLTLRLLFETKNLEIASIFETYPDRSVYIRLSKIDPSHTGIYEERRNAPR